MDSTSNISNLLKLGVRFAKDYHLIFEFSLYQFVSVKITVTWTSEEGITNFFKQLKHLENCIK